MVDAYLTVLVGWKRTDPISGREIGGLFGPVDYYFGMVEEQGRKTLHFHSVVRLEHAPRPSELTTWLKTTEGPKAAFKARFFAWLEDLIRMDLPTAPGVPVFDPS